MDRRILPGRRSPPLPSCAARRSPAWPPLPVQAPGGDPRAAPPPKPEALRCAVSDEDGDHIESLVVPIGVGGRDGGVLGGEAKEGWELEEGSVAEPE
jgi:hypothetical protein